MSRPALRASRGTRNRAIGGPACPRCAWPATMSCSPEAAVSAVAAAAAAARPGEQGPPDEWDRFYSLNYTDPDAKPVLLTTTDGLIEDATSSILSPDGRTFYYCTNATDIERRHIWAVPVSGGQPRQVTTGRGIETHPAPLASGALATLSATWNMPQSLGIWSSPTSQKIIFPTTRPGFPTEAHVEPELVITHPEDRAFEIKNQLFLPKNSRPGEKHPAMIFVHGGPVRQMLLGYHYRYVYHQFYAINQWLASRGYVVLSINFRGGVGYGRSFRNAPGTNLRGNSEYQDVLAGAKYLQSRPDVDPKRIGIYGLSYGGLLTAQALARNSDIFAAGVDYAGVHLYGSSLDPTTVAYQVVGDFADRQLEVARPHHPWRRRSQRVLRADGRARAVAAPARRVLRAHRPARRRARFAAPQPVAGMAGADGCVPAEGHEGRQHDRALVSFCRFTGQSSGNYCNHVGAGFSPCPGRLNVRSSPQSAHPLSSKHLTLIRSAASWLLLPGHEYCRACA